MEASGSLATWLRPLRPPPSPTKVLFRCEKFLDFVTVTLLFVCDKYCLIID